VYLPDTSTGDRQITPPLPGESDEDTTVFDFKIHFRQWKY